MIGQEKSQNGDGDLMRRRAWLTVPLLVALALAGGETAPTAAASPPPPGLRLLEATSSGLVLEWVAPSVEVRSLNDGTVEVVAEGYARTEQPGVPVLPFTATLIALPPGASPHLRVLSTEETPCPLVGPLTIAPRPAGVVRDERGRSIGGAFASASWKSQSPIASPVILEEIGVVRGVRLARLAFYPARREGQTLRVVRRLRVEVSWETWEHPARVPSSLLLDQVRRAVLNPWDAFPVPRPPTPLALQPTSGVTPTAFIEIDAPGLYRVTSEDLEGLGFAGTDPQNLRLFRGDNEVAYEWEGDDDALFEPRENLLFYADPRFSRWTDTDVYRLVADGTPGLRMTTRSGDPTGLPIGVSWVEQVIEENHFYTPDRFAGSLPAGRDGDRWVWDYLSQPGHAAETYPFSLTAVDGTSTATLALWLIGYTSGGHHWEVALNGTTLGQVVWTGQSAVTATLSIPAHVLRSGNNLLSVSLPEVEGAWLDAFAVRYGRGPEPVEASVRFGIAPATPGDSPPTLPHRLYLPLVLRCSDPSGTARAYAVALASPGPYRAYDITNALRPLRLTGIQMEDNAVTVGDPPGSSPRRYIVAAESAILRPSRVRPAYNPFGLDGSEEEPAGAHLLIITHPAFADALTSLVSLRQSQGLSTTVVSVLGIYDAWGDGRPDPGAIRAFIADAYTTWNPRPIYVLLVGDGSFDPRQYRPDSPPTFIPPYLADVDPWAGETAADNRYACVDGDDTLPDLLLGRLPVDSLEETQTMVEKIVAYESTPFPGGWNADVLLVADDADSAGDFAASSDTHAAAHVTSPFTVTRHYCAGISPYISDCQAQQVDTLYNGLLAEWNQGALLLQFTGHSSWQQWAAERFFHMDDLPALLNDRRLPVVVEMTCFTSAFHRPEPTLDEDLVALSGGGAVAAWGPTGLGVGTGHGYLSDGFFSAVFAEGAETVGEATLAGKLELVANGQNLDLLDTFTLLGDPALRLNRTIVPWAERVFLPLVRRRP